MDQADAELRVTITHIWPLQAKKMLDLLVPTKEAVHGKITVGKIYAGLLILESWRNTRFGGIDGGPQVCFDLKFACTFFFINFKKTSPKLFLLEYLL